MLALSSLFPKLLFMATFRDRILNQMTYSDTPVFSGYFKYFCINYFSNLSIIFATLFLAHTICNYTPTTIQSLSSVNTIQGLFLDQLQHCDDTHLKQNTTHPNPSNVFYVLLSMVRSFFSAFTKIVLNCTKTPLQLNIYLPKCQKSLDT